MTPVGTVITTVQALDTDQVRHGVQVELVLGTELEMGTFTEIFVLLRTTKPLWK